MALKKRGKYRYGDSQADIRAEVLRYSKTNAYLAHHFADATRNRSRTRGRSRLRSRLAHWPRRRATSGRRNTGSAERASRTPSCRRQEEKLRVGFLLRIIDVGRMGEGAWLHEPPKGNACGLQTSIRQRLDRTMGHERASKADRHPGARQGGRMHRHGFRFSG